ncbi:MAG: Uma2 family endonuclease [Acetobacteraceae bacterium]
MGRALRYEPENRMTRENYRAWAAAQPSGRFERIAGIVVAMAPERAAHNLRKGSARDALRRAVRQANLPCEVFGDGMTIEVGESDYEPDAVLRCGERLAGDAVAVPDPLVIVEVLSPSTSGIDRGLKLRDYFTVASLQHYLIVWPETSRIIRHSRVAAGGIDTEIFTAGEFGLDPPGITLAVEEFYAD